MYEANIIVFKVWLTVANLAPGSSSPLYEYSRPAARYFF